MSEIIVTESHYYYDMFKKMTIGLAVVNMAVFIRLVDIPVYFGRNWVWAAPDEIFTLRNIVAGCFGLMLVAAIGICIDVWWGLGRGSSNLRQPLPEHEEVTYSAVGLYFTLMSVVFIDFSQGVRSGALFFFMYMVFIGIFRTDPMRIICSTCCVLGLRMYRATEDMNCSGKHICKDDYFIIRHKPMNHENVKFFKIADNLFYCHAQKN